MRIIGEEGWQREQIEKEMQDFENRLKTISAGYGNVEDLTWYILDRKRSILELQSILYNIQDTIGYDSSMQTIGTHTIDMIEKLDTWLSKLNSSIEDIYIELLEYQVWTEHQEELKD